MLWSAAKSASLVIASSRCYSHRLCQFSVCQACPTLLSNKKKFRCLPDTSFVLRQHGPFPTPSYGRRLETQKKKHLSNTLKIVHLRSEGRAPNCNLQDRVVRASQKQCRSTMERDRVASTDDFSLCGPHVQRTRRLTHATPRKSQRAPTPPQKSSQRAFLPCDHPHQANPAEWSQAEKRQIMSQSYSWNPVKFCLSCKLSRTRAIRACSSATAPKTQLGKRK